MNSRSPPTSVAAVECEVWAELEVAVGCEYFCSTSEVCSTDLETGFSALTGSSISDSYC